VHRDIKPANIWLDANAGGRVKILDFGLARASQDAQLTQSGVIVGTAAYMAPEQARGQALDARADLYSLGGVLYRLCTGQVPFQRADMLATLVAVTSQQPVPVRDHNPEVPPALEALILRLLAGHRPERQPPRQPAGRASLRRGGADGPGRGIAAAGGLRGAARLEERPGPRATARPACRQAAGGGAGA